MNRTTTKHARFRCSIVCGALVLASLLQAANAQSAAPRDTLVVTTQWLKQHLNEKDLVLLHVGNKDTYSAGHIQGARFVDLETFGPRAASNGLILELPSSEALHGKLQDLGISDASRVVVYFDAREVQSSTRIIFTLDAAGLGDRVSLLDGGLQAWQQGGNALTTVVPEVKPGKLAPLSMQQRVVDADFVQQHLKKPGYKIVDARAPMFYDGVRAGMAPAGRTVPKGHLPGATNIPFSSVTTMDVTLKPADELAALFEAGGVAQGDRVIVYCHIGQQATAIIFAARTLGIDAVLYDGSFQDWAQRGLPVEMPAASNAP